MLEKILDHVLSRMVRRGNLDVVTANGEILEFGDRSGPKVRVRFADQGAELALLRDPDMQLGELFMSGRFIVEAGTIYDFIELTLQDYRTTPPPGFFRAIDQVRSRMSRLTEFNTKARAKANVAHHYDLGNDLYRLFLDPDMQYSCAYFETPEQSLAAAQRAKKRHIASKLMIEPGNRVLDIGCGWGGMALYLAEFADAGHVTGITLSQEQIALATERRVRSAAGSRVEFRIEDYRNTQGPYDRIVSVGMFEHVGLRHYQTFFNRCHSLLKDDGVMVLHTIASVDEPGWVMPWLKKYIFPGAHVPSMSEIAPAIERAGLVLADVEVLQLHYALTLRHWRNNFMAKRDDAKRMYDERFCRMWEFYLAGGEAAFRYEGIAIYQFVLTKYPGRLPMTRDWMFTREAELRTRDGASNPEKIATA